MIRVTLSNRPDLCEYQCNGAMAGAKAYRKAPIMIANDVVAKLENSECIAEVQAVNPGFINMKLNDKFVADYLNQMEADEALGLDKAENPKTIVIDYGGPNVAKPLHVGHMRPAIVGESIKRIIDYVGHKTISDVHLGDIGLPIGEVIYACLRDGVKVDDITLDYLNKGAIKEDDLIFKAHHAGFTPDEMETCVVLLKRKDPKEEVEEE